MCSGGKCPVHHSSCVTVRCFELRSKYKPLSICINMTLGAHHCLYTGWALHCSFLCVCVFYFYQSCAPLYCIASSMYTVKTDRDKATWVWLLRSASIIKTWSQVYICIEISVSSKAAILFICTSRENCNY